MIRSSERGLYTLLTEANYNTIEDVSSALKQRQVRGALVDIFSAASRSDLFLQSDIIAKKSLEYPSAYGFVLSGDMKNAAPDFRSYLSSQADRILAFMKEKSAGLEVMSVLLNLFGEALINSNHIFNCNLMGHCIFLFLC